MPPFPVATVGNGIEVQMCYLKVLHDIGRFIHVAFVLLDLGKNTGHTSALHFQVHLIHDNIHKRERMVSKRCSFLHNFPPGELISSKMTNKNHSLCSATFPSVTVLRVSMSSSLVFMSGV